MSNGKTNNRNGVHQKGKGRSTGFLSLAAILLLGLVLTLAACGSSKSDHSSAVAPEAMNQEADGMQAAEPAAKAAADIVAQPSAGTSEELSFAAAAEPGSGSAGGIGPIAGADAGMNRKVIYKANVSMKVPHFDSAEEKLRDAIHLSGSYILQFSNSMDAGGKGATYVIKVPADGFSSFIDQLRKIEKDLQLQMEGSDVTEEYVDLNARLLAKKTVESRMLVFMDKATKTDDLVRFSNELAGVQEQIEQIKGRMRYLDQNVAYSTVNVRLYEGTADVEVMEKEKAGFGERITGAIRGSAEVMGEFGQALLVFLAALLPVAVVAAVVGVPVYFIIRGQRRNRRESAALRRKEWNGGGQPEEPLPDESPKE